LASLGITKILPAFIPLPLPAFKNHIAALLSEKEAPLIKGRVVGYRKGIHVNVKIILFGLGVRLVFLALGFFFMHPEGFSGSIGDIFYNFNRWDAHHYIRLATYGYTWTERGHPLLVVFFPLYPYIIRLVNFAVRDVLISAYFVSFASFLAGLCYVYHLVRLDFCKRTAWWAVVLISIFPTSFFFGAPHTESLFMLTTAATLYYIRRHKWLMVGIAGAMATATRMVGVILIAAAAVEFAMHYNIFTYMKKGNWKRFFGLFGLIALCVLMMFTGIVVYLFINWHITGDPLRFLYYQSYNWHNGFQYFGEAMRGQVASMPITRVVGIRYNSMLFINMPNVLGFGFTIWMIAYGFIRRHKSAYIVYALGYTFVSFSMVWLLSGGRYAAALVPSFIFLADYVRQKPLKRGVIVVLIFIALLLPILRMYMQGGYVM